MVAVVTGGCKGLGQSFSEYLLNKGYTVYALYNTSEENAIKMMEKYPNLRCIKCDVTNEESIKDFVDSLESIDILINNAAIAIDNEYSDKTKEEFMRVLETNVVGPFLMMKYASKKIVDNGVVINISSNNAIDNYNPISMDYDASKSALNMLTKDFALALPNVKIVSICPGWIDTLEVRKANPLFIKEEMAKSGQKELLDPEKLVNKIFEELPNLESGSIKEIKEV